MNIFIILSCLPTLNQGKYVCTFTNFKIVHITEKFEQVFLRWKHYKDLFKAISEKQHRLFYWSTSKRVRSSYVATANEDTSLFMLRLFAI